jgi:hypothetical protein
MAEKSDFSETEWESLRKGATGAGLLVSVSDRGIFDSFKEASALARHLAGGRSKSESKLVRELSGERPKGFGVTTSPNEIEAETTEALREAIATLSVKAPDEVEAYRAFVLELATAVGEAAGGGDEAEAAALERIRAALG